MFADSNLTIIENKFCSFDKCFYICNPKQNNGALAERLGTGLQNLLQRFDSARHLQKMPLR